MSDKGKIHKSERGFYEDTPHFERRYPNPRIIRNGRISTHKEELIDVESTSFDSRFTSEKPPPELTMTNINFAGPVFYQEQLKSQQELQPRKRGRPRNPQVDVYNHHMAPIGRPVYEERTARMPIHLKTDDSIREISFVKSLPEFHTMFPPRYRAPGGPTYSQILAGERMSELTLMQEGLINPYLEDAQRLQEVAYTEIEEYQPTTSEKFKEVAAERIISRTQETVEKPKEIWTRGPGGKKYLFRLVKKNKEEAITQENRTFEKPKPLPPILLKRDVRNNEENSVSKRSRKEKHTVAVNDPESTISARITLIRKRQPDDAYLISEQEIMGTAQK